jgi:hypothetical protein
MQTLRLRQFTEALQTVLNFLSRESCHAAILHLDFDAHRLEL